MSRLIDAEELIEVAHRARLDSRELIEQMIESAPTVEAVPVAELPYTVWLTHDVVQVVRCKDCKWHYILDGHSHCDLDIEARDIKPDWFCADGERREDGSMV